MIGVGDAEAGLAAHRAQPMDAVLTDINLPGMSGCEFAKALRALHGPYPRIDGMSGVALSPADTSVFDHFFVKPMNLNDLASALADY